MIQRRAILHIGTHKTGTKTIQAFLGDNWESIYNAGVYIPNTGRVSLGKGQYSPGHHDLATGLRESNPSLLEALRVEIAAISRPHLLLSSEEFYPLLGQPDALLRLSRFFQTLGYEPYVIVYLREQTELAVSMYAEMAKRFRPPAFAEYIDEIIRFGELYHGNPYRIIFEYSRALLDLADIVGAKNVVARRYTEGRDPTKLIADFVRTISAVLGGLEISRLEVLTPSLNQRLSFGDVIRALDKDGLLRLGIDTNDTRLRTPFAPQLRAESLAMRARFREDNERVAALANIRITAAGVDDPQAEDFAAWQRSILDQLWLRNDA